MSEVPACWNAPGSFLYDTGPSLLYSMFQHDQLIIMDCCCSKLCSFTLLIVTCRLSHVCLWLVVWCDHLVTLNLAQAWTNNQQAYLCAALILLLNNFKGVISSTGIAALELLLADFWLGSTQMVFGHSSAELLSIWKVVECIWMSKVPTYHLWVGLQTLLMK